MVPEKNMDSFFVFHVLVLQVCWGNYDTLTRHGLKVQKIKKGMAVNMKLAFAYCSLNLFNLTQPIPF